MNLDDETSVHSPSADQKIASAATAITMSKIDEPARTAPETHAITMSSTTQPCRIAQDSPLLSLPPELRNQIYELILISPPESKPTITPTYLPPALISVCHQIRTESLKLWLSSNTFSITILNCEVELAKRFQNTFMSTSGLKEGPKMSFRMKGSPNWGNLMHWCEAVYMGETTWFQCKENAKGLSVVVTAATRMAGTPGRKGWERVREDLEGWRHVAGIVDERWLVDDGEGEGEGGGQV
ncbi:uncharacterized protein MYCFIDRAFT_80567 [Pseudocercospora fijiensis CIRAD86]|uniref:F-box domain-containing protein n=1 Tax=Pseudocercospora fijiensis (strain CIRAD86) TaxID=383855 RepID=M2ZVG4_PSEFD|nr:uncharacterized protein MYCFIDRAFT_80567 [Pseudocercospora fijiensis CIRAD86]EME82994.1 hypothetical protein MYCFIDRAFT_80567 [Pseudocercospora fijiensis CIRAD86]